MIAPALTDPGEFPIKQLQSGQSVSSNFSLRNFRKFTRPRDQSPTAPEASRANARRVLTNPDS